MSIQDQQVIMKKILDDRHSACFKYFYQLFQLLLNDARILNDTASGDEMLKTQGEIRRLNHLLKNLNPTTLKERIHYDGGFGE